MFLRILAVWGIGIAITVLAFFAILLIFPFDRKRDSIHSIGVLWSRILLKLAGIKVEVRGVENIPKGPVVFASNHQSAFDIPALQGSLPVQFRWVAKQSLFKVPFIGWSMWLAGYIGIEREHAGEAYRSIELAAEKIKKGTSVLVFPEGTRSANGRLLPFKRGAFHLASKSGVPVVPVAIRGTVDVMRRGSFRIHPGNVTIDVLPPVKAVDDEKKLRNLTRNAIQRYFASEASGPDE